MLTRLTRQRDGLSMIELLVTIIIAGIAFVAIVPLFVLANKKNLEDNVRVQAKQVAQDKIEKLRQLPYGSIQADAAHPFSTPNLYNPTFADSQFGPTQTLSSGSTSRVIKLRYTVQPYPAVTTGLQSEYKIVTIEAYWDAPPSPVKSTILSTIVYRQYAGPPISSMTLTPGMDDDAILGNSSLTSVWIKAHVDLSAGSLPAYIEFAIAGPSTASRKVLATETNSGSDAWYDSANGNFNWRWDCSAATNGGYDIAATAFSADGFVGNTFHLYPIIQHTVPPAAPAAVTASPGDTKADLEWNDSSEPKRSQYEICRSTSASGPWDATTLIATVPYTTLTYTNTGLTNGTTYYYAVRTLTSDSRSSEWRVSNPVVPKANSDTTPPTAPTGLAATAIVSGIPTVRLSWSASTDPGAPSSGVDFYEIWRSADNSNWGSAEIGRSTTTGYDDATAGPSKQWYYKVRAVDVALNRGSFSSSARNPTPTGVFPTHSLTVNVKNGAGACWVWVQYTKSGQIYTQHYFSKAGVDQGLNPINPGTPIAKNSFVAFAGLPDGDYTVWATDVSSTFNMLNDWPPIGAQLNGGNNSCTVAPL